MTRYRREAVLCTLSGLVPTLEKYATWRLVAMTYAPAYADYTLIFEQEEE